MTKVGIFAQSLIVISTVVLCVQAQDNGPDYSNVTDFLNGRRTLLEVDDVMIGPLVIKTQNGTQVDPSSIYPAPLIPPHDQFSGPQMLTRMFDLPSDTVVWGRATDIHATNPVTKQDQSSTLSIYNTKFAGSTLAAGDFNGDGFSEVVLASVDTLQVISAVDPEDFSKGLQTGGAYNYPLAQFIPVSVAVGDFNGDGKPEVAIAYQATATDNSMHVQIFTVDPATLNLTLQGDIGLGPNASPAGPGSGALVAGRFSNTAYEQLAIVYASNNQVQVQSLDFKIPSLTPILVGTQLSNVSPGPDLWAVKGHFDPNSPYDQMAMKYGNWLGIVSFDSQLHIQYPSFLAAPGISCSTGLAAGNFARTDPDSSNSSATQPSLKQQIAISTSDCHGDNLALSIYNVEPPAVNSVYFTITQTSVLGMDLAASFVQYYGTWIISGDIQGRSLILGAPTKITMSSAIQPSVVIGVPPMHVDFVSPDPAGGAKPQVMNLSAVPDGFKTTYEQDDSTDQKSGSTNTTSWSFGAKESVNASVTIGDPDVEGFKASDTLTAAQKLKGSAEHDHGTFQGKTYNLSQTTGFGDEVSYLDPEFNIWLYPVIGKVVCPAATPNCPAGQKVPLTIQFSAPNGDAFTHASQGQALQWYQPPWEPGNVLSYPATLLQLQRLYPNLAVLTNEGTQFITDTSTQTEKTTWSVTTKDSVTTSLNQNYSFKNDFSVTGSLDYFGVTVGGGYSINLSGSDGLSNLTKNTTDLGTSTGVQVSKPGTFPSFQSYAYLVSPYLMGTTEPGGYVDSQPLSGDVQTFGLLRAMYTADPLASSAGAWWQQAYSQAPDVALNHPSRWQVTTPALSNPIPSNCLATGTGASQMDCAELAVRLPENPWLSIFHQMRGFFISSAQSPGQGPQLEQANAGDILTLQARVYNYSLAAMPSNGQVHVRFYFTPWNKTVPAGDSVLIGEEVLGPIPPFNDNPNAPLNWVLANTTFDTSKYDETKNGDASVVFWVVVWIQAADGTLVHEMPGHGLTSIPGTLKSLADVAEECQSDGNCYSNNLGLYHQIFYIAQPPGLGGPLGTPSPAGKASVDVGKVDLSTRRVTPHDTIVVSATLSASGAAASGISAYFYDGDPEQGGRLFDVERIPHIAQADPFPVQASYQTNACGTHELFVVVNRGKASEVIRRAPPLRVECSPNK